MNLFIALCVLGYVNFGNSHSDCDTRKTCGECIGCATEKCVWCAEETTMSRRCQPEHSVNETWCKKDFIYTPNTNNVPTIVKNDNFSSTVQFRPQIIKIKASPGVPVNFTMSYKSADDFPLDVYFIMDFSYTMKAHKEALQNQALSIYEGLKKLTKNVLLGIGSFVEKPALPYVDTHELLAYAFKNHLALTKNMSSFENVIKNSNTFGSNYDDAEAGLDALMQAMTCEKELGWRNNTRRIIVLVTDSTYHSAGDGKMLGAVKPNDMQCHLDGDEYNRTISVTHDYPSVSLISKVADKGKFTIIFAALLKVKHEYEALAKQILGAKYAELKEESNIFQIIKAAYDESVENVVINSEAPDPYIQLTVDQDCESKPTVNCKRSPANPIVSIPVSVKSTVCPKPGANEYVITINPMGLNEKLTITFEVDCQCKCEENIPSTPSTECSNAGIFQCGSCQCNPDRGGDSCQFNCSDEDATDLNKKCIQQANSTIECNNHGTCRCGQCDCNPKFSGEYCQFDDTSCPSKNGKLCAGNGECKYAECECKEGWSGLGCECPKSNEQCIGPFSAKVCSGRGECNCGTCICNKIENTNETYLGAFCDFCDECATERCEELKNYAKCNRMDKKEVCDKLTNTHNADIDVLVANKSELFNMSEWKMGTKCRTELDDGTFLLFKYKAVPGTRKLLLMIQKEVEPPTKADIWLAVGSAIAAILLIGLLTAILWKILVDLYDKREYNKFCDEAKAQGYDVIVSQNPLYETPTQNFVNPGFNRNLQ